MKAGPLVVLVVAVLAPRVVLADGVSALILNGVEDGVNILMVNGSHAMVARVVMAIGFAPIASIITVVIGVPASVNGTVMAVAGLKTLKLKCEDW
jgi:hypothetical protein